MGSTTMQVNALQDEIPERLQAERRRQHDLSSRSMATKVTKTKKVSNYSGQWHEGRYIYMPTKVWFRSRWRTDSLAKIVDTWSESAESSCNKWSQSCLTLKALS
ncbi:hypothetical protein RF11_14205 [Thelohanellus kitauei]|uniref:Uncharacterized protein n=1 Tax=Thelohanellus kitauei TaxID=669202 RepID=A0A0C2MRT2_THEKT|nr:hypothetical protein RF11_14205 [Thelohanellus kitauei]